MGTDLAALRARLAQQRVMEVETKPSTSTAAIADEPAPKQEEEPHMITEHSEVITELKEEERPDSDYIHIGGQAIAKDNPIFAKLNIIWESDASAMSAETVRLTVMERLQMLEPSELAQLILNKELAAEFGIPNLAMYREVFNIEVVKVKDMTLHEIDARIERHQKMIEQINILIQADITVKVEKNKKEKREQTKQGDEEYRRKKADVFKKKLAARPVKHLSEDEKLIRKLMLTMNVSYEKAKSILEND